MLLALWAIAAASDYDTGLIRVLVQAQPNRLKLLGGKIIALTGFTVLATQRHNVHRCVRRAGRWPGSRASTPRPGEQTSCPNS